MEKTQALDALSALGHDMRLDIFRLLVRAGPAGLPAGAVADALDALPSTLSANLSLLARAGLVHARREGRSIRYFADMGGMSALLAFLMEDCCGGQPELCQPALTQISCACDAGQTHAAQDPH